MFAHTSDYASAKKVYKMFFGYFAAARGKRLSRKYGMQIRDHTRSIEKRFSICRDPAQFDRKDEEIKNVQIG